MKWLPIADLSDTQRNGDWIYFAFKSSVRQYGEEYQYKNGWHEEDEVSKWGWYSSGNFFLSDETIPECYSHCLDVVLPEIE